jgi:hypothetical protein
VAARRGTIRLRARLRTADAIDVKPFTAPCLRLLSAARPLADLSVATLLVACVGLGPALAAQVRQDGQGGQKPPARPRPEAPVDASELGVTLDESGWPVPVTPQGSTNSPSRLGSGQAEVPNALDAPRAPVDGGTGSTAPAASAVAGAGSEGLLAPTLRATGDPLAPDSALHEVFRAVGTPTAAEAIGVIQIAGSLVMRDDAGRHVGTRYFVHDLDYAKARRDRLRYEEQDGVATVYGRDGGSVFAERHLFDDSAVPLANTVEAADELDLLGLLARVPWCFADRESFRMGPTRSITTDGRNYEQLEFERTASSGTDRFRLLCVRSAGGLEPAELRYTLAEGPGVETRVRLLDAYSVSRKGVSVRVPMQRWLVDGNGRPLLEIVYVRVDPQAAEDPSLWRAGR